MGDSKVYAKNNEDLEPLLIIAMFNEDIEMRLKSGKCAADTLKRRYTNKSAELKESYKREQI